MVRQAIETTLRMVDNELRQRARLELDIVDTPPVGVPASQLCQVLLNMLVNAFQALPLKVLTRSRSRSGPPTSG